MPDDDHIPPDWLARYVTYTDHVAKLCTIPDKRADLRSAPSPFALEEPWRMLPHLLNRMPSSTIRQFPYLCTASMYAQQTGPARREKSTPVTFESWHGNLGWSLRKAIGSDVLNESTTGKRLLLLARQPSMITLYPYLRPLVAHIRRAGTPVSWPRLLRDLDRWDRWHTDVTREWMRDFYSDTEDH